jgi:hypothetical protein
MQGYQIVAYDGADPESVTAENYANACKLTADRMLKSWAATRKQAESVKNRMEDDYPESVVLIH